MGAKSVRLYVSYDRGQQWTMIASVLPSEKKFVFKTKKDGEYWFAVRTVVQQNTLVPARSVRDPGLKVIVDTKLPRLDFRIQQLEPGKVELHWTASDDFLDVKTLRFEYRSSKLGKWSSLTTTHRKEGSISWLVSHGKDLYVRGSVSDLAKNKRSKVQLFQMTSADGFVPKPRIPDFNQPIAKKSHPNKSLPVVFPRTTRDGKQIRQKFSQTNVSAKRTDILVNRRRSQPTQRADIRPKTSLIDPVWKKKLRDSRRSFSAPSPIRHRKIPAKNSAFPLGSAARASYINSRKFEIKYRVDHLGSSGVNRVDLYVTENHGKKWYRYGSDPDRKSPFQVTLPRQGTYGFALRVTSRAGMGLSPPEPGEEPDLSVTVDRTPPLISSLVLKTVGEPIPHKVLINWRISDDRLATVPVSLYYAEKANGPWVLIEDGIADTGQYQWNISSLNLTKVYFRMKVQDLAGNETIKSNKRPFYLDRSTPSASILEVSSKR